MADDAEHARAKATSGSKHAPNQRSGGDPVQEAQKPGGGSKRSKGPVTSQDKHNPNSSAKA